MAAFAEHREKSGKTLRDDLNENLNKDPNAPCKDIDKAIEEALKQLNPIILAFSRISLPSYEFREIRQGVHDGASRLNALKGKLNISL
jgi:hypothetical protein